MKSPYLWTMVTWSHGDSVKYYRERKNTFFYSPIACLFRFRFGFQNRSIYNITAFAVFHSYFTPHFLFGWFRISNKRLDWYLMWVNVVQMFPMLPMAFLPNDSSFAHRWQCSIQMFLFPVLPMRMDMWFDHDMNMSSNQLCTFFDWNIYSSR